MSDVKRLNFTVSQFESVVPYASEHGQYVRFADYAKLEAEAQALREEVARINSLASCGSVQYWLTLSDEDKARWFTLYCRKADENTAMHRELEELRARVVVVPDAANDRRKSAHYCRGWNSCLDELACLNGRVVSEGVLQRIDLVLGAIRSHDFHGIINTIGEGWRDAVDEMRAELQAVIGEKREGTKP
ncbi:hypothetical protein [Pseudomonas citronellolis]|uniref:hypothetical protein n=1 Tax=Pseudomonas citronellolis TaxID=53408 RepID=UPI002FD8E2C9